MQYKVYTRKNFKNIKQMSNLSDQQIRDIEIVSSVLPFKTNNYVVDHLIDWSRVPDDPIFILNFPQREMLLPEHFSTMERLFDAEAPDHQIREAANEIRLQLNPHPAGQLEHNVPIWRGQRLNGFQHKYRETVLFFPSQGQTCHAYCTFCFRWPQFVGLEELKQASGAAELLVDYISNHPSVTDVLFTGGDPLTMRTSLMESYLRPLNKARIPQLRNIRLGSKALAYWPYRCTADDDADDLLNLFSDVRESGLHLALMAHFNHTADLEGETVKQAIHKIQASGAVIRTQSPVLKHINDSPSIWADMWKKQVALNCIPYYMFVARDTGAQHYFAVSLEQAWQIFRQAYQSVCGICRTVRGPVMSCLPGKVQVLGVAPVRACQAFVLRILQGRNPDWVARPFLAEYNPTARWFTDLKPLFDEDGFFFDSELGSLLEKGDQENRYDLENSLV